MLLIQNGTVHDGLGHVLAGTDVLIEDGRIRQVGQKLSAPDARKIDAAGKQVLPGMISALTAWGMTGPGWGESDMRELDGPANPELNVIYGFDHGGMNFQEVFNYGVTAAGLAAYPGLVLGGQIAVVKTYGASPYQALVREAVAMGASVTKAVKEAFKDRHVKPMTRMGSFSILIDTLRKAQHYRPAKGYDAKCEALLPVLRGEMPLLINCALKSEMDGIERAMREFPEVSYVFTGAYGLTADRESVSSHKRAVILGDLTDAMGTDNESPDYEGIRALVEGGADIAISSCGDRFAGGKESLLWNAILWHKNGIGSEDVLRMVTHVPAKILGVSDQIGSIEPGKQADLSIWTANPIETYAARQELVLIGGEQPKGRGGNASCW